MHGNTTHRLDWLRIWWKLTSCMFTDTIEKRKREQWGNENNQKARIKQNRGSPELNGIILII